MIDYPLKSMNQGWIYREQVHLRDEGQTILEYYTQKYRHSSSQDWLQRIIDGQVKINDLKVTPQTQLQRGQWLSYQRSPWQEPNVPLSFKIIYQDQHLLVINKPSGLPVLPGGNFLENTLLWQLKKYDPQGQAFPIHRLGRGTSGLILIGRSHLSRSYLTQQIREHNIKKVYRALIEKCEIPDSFKINQPIGKIDHPELGYIYAATPQGKWAYSEGQVLKKNENNTLIEVTILTGRPHQIRIHLASLGYPLLGDPLYTLGGIPKANSSKMPGDVGYFLHAYQLSLLHPITHKPINFTCPEPISWTNP